MTASRLLLLQFEWRLQVRQVAFGLAVLLMALMAAALAVTGFGPGVATINAPAVVVQSLGLLSLMAVFVMMILVASAALREWDSGMTELVYATPVRRASYLGSRLGGALLAGMTVMVVAAVAHATAAPLLGDPERIGAVRPIGYLWALGVLVVPNLCLAAVILFAVAILSRRSLPTYFAGIAIFAGYFVTALLINSPLMAGSATPTPEAMARAAILDPFGLSAFFEQTRYWTAHDWETRLPSLHGHLLLNRLLWLMVTAGLLALTALRFRFELPVTAGRGTRRTRAAADPVPDAAYRAVTADAPSWRGFRAAFLSATRLELRLLVGGWVFPSLLGLWAFVAAMEGVAQLTGAEYGTHIVPTGGLLLRAIGMPFGLLGTITVLYFAAEVAWRQRAVRIDPLLDATPAPAAARFLAKATALASVPMMLAGVGVVVALAIQLASGHGIDHAAVLLTMPWFHGMPLVILAIAALALQMAAPNRWIGLLAGAALVILARRGGAIGLEHPLLRYGTVPDPVWSDITGFGGVEWSFVAFLGYWVALASVLAVIGWGVMPRGHDAGLARRIADLPRRLGATGRVVGLVAGALTVASGGLLFWHTQANDRWEGQNAQATWKAGYEQRYRRLADLPGPTIVETRLDADLRPSSRRGAFRGSLVLENRTAVPIDTVWVVMRRDMIAPTVSMPEASDHLDALFGVHALALATPMRPNDRRMLTFAFRLDRSGIRATASDLDLVPGGAFLTSLDLLPSLGYRSSYELTDPRLRRRHGLPDAPSGLAPLPTSDAALAALHRSGDQRAWSTLDLTIATDPGQVALGPGSLVRRWTEGGRPHVRYVVNRPVRPVFAILSARQEVQRSERDGIGIEVWHHPAHQRNVPRMLEAAARTLAFMDAKFGRYPHDVLRIVEVPEWAPFAALAMPGLVLFSEDRGFRTDARAGDVDLITRRVAHEVAHQWWGHTLDPATVEGAVILNESLAKYIEQRVVAEAGGEGAVPPILAFDEDRYLSGRADDRMEPPLLTAVGRQDHLYYGKGAVVMQGIHRMLGGAVVDSALADLLARFGGEHGAATTLDLLATLRARAPTDEARRLIEAWFRERVVYDMRVDTATVSRLPNGRYTLQARVIATSTNSGPQGETSRSVDGEHLEIAVLNGDLRTTRPLALQEYRVWGDSIIVNLELPTAPTEVVVDPYFTRLDRIRGNNSRQPVEADRSHTPVPRPTGHPGLE